MEVGLVRILRRAKRFSRYRDKGAEGLSNSRTFVGFEDHDAVASRVFCAAESGRYELVAHALGQLEFVTAPK
jgi:hypothetical protein